MKSIHLQSTLCMIFGLAICLPSFADDGDVATVGPSGRSSALIGLDNFHFNYDQLWKYTGSQVGYVSGSGSSMVFSGIYAPTDQFTVSATIPWNFSGNQDVTWFGQTNETNVKVTLRNVNLAAIVIDNKADHGFKLVAGGGSNWLASESGFYYGYLQPQYRLDRSLLLTSTFTVEHQATEGDNQSLALGLLWSPNSQWTFNPSASYNHVNETPDISSHNSRSVGLSTTYHLNRTWAVSASTGLSRGSALTYANYANANDNDKSYSFNAAIRNYFN